MVFLLIVVVLTSIGTIAWLTRTSSILRNMLLLLLIFIVASSIAYLVKKNSISNNFVVGKVKAEIAETIYVDSKTKKNVYIKNTGNVRIYINSTKVISWKDKEGKILHEKPEENIDYSIKFSDSKKWLKSNDGYYYYKNSINPNVNTDILIEECKQINEYDDRILEVSIANQAIQAEPSYAVKEVWNVDIIDNILILKE